MAAVLRTVALKLRIKIPDKGVLTIADLEGVDEYLKAVGYVERIGYDHFTAVVPVEGESDFDLGWNASERYEEIATELLSRGWERPELENRRSVLATVPEGA
jgi:hypothetical protein